MNKRIYLVRHGETHWNTARRIQGQLNSPLTDTGIKQANWLAESLIDTRIDVIYSSPLGRAYKTAQIIAKDKNIPIIKKDELKELYFGSWEGQLKDELSQKYSKVEYNLWNAPHKYIPTDGETFEELLSRSKIFFEEVILKTKYENILIVSHAIMLKGFINTTQKNDLIDFWAGPHIQPTSLTKAKLVEGDLIYEVIGDISHYKEKSSFNGWFSDD